MQPTKYKLRGLYAKIDVLENDVMVLQEDVERYTNPQTPSKMDSPDSTVVATQPKVPKHPLDD
ncbi:hypothetical protein HAX54_021935, partial [Datura stramonium]|nr:hypothetical protein [Datura stramonium]